MIRLQIKTFNRSQKSSVGAAAYRSGERLRDERTGRIYDYTKKSGIRETGFIGPIANRADLWNAAESSENRQKSRVARELILSLPHEATEEQHIEAVRKMGLHLRETYGVAADYAIHEANRKGDSRNVHAHLMFTTRKVSSKGEFGAKTRVLDGNQSRGEVEKMRKKWSEICQSIAANKEEWDHRSFAEQGVEKAPKVRIPNSEYTEIRDRVIREHEERGEVAKPSDIRKVIDTERKNPEREANRIKRTQVRAAHFQARDNKDQARLEKEAKKELPEAPEPLRGLRRWWPASKEAFEERKKRYERIRKSSVAIKRRAEIELARVEKRLKQRRGMLKFLERLDAERELTPEEEKRVQEWSRARPLAESKDDTLRDRQEQPKRKHGPKL